MVGSVFQIAALAAGFFIARLPGHGRAKALTETIKVFLLPAAIVLFYAFPASYGDRTIAPVNEEWNWFKDFWIHEAAVIPMMLFAAGLFWFNKKERFRSAAPLGVLFVFLAGPVIFWITKNRGYFVTNRQYIYYDAHRAVFVMCCVYLLPLVRDYFKGRARRAAAVILIVVSLLPLVFSRKNINRLQEAGANAAEFLGSK